jgi:hypothetical protein
MRVARRAMGNDPVGLCRHGAVSPCGCDSSAYVGFRQLRCSTYHKLIVKGCLMILKGDYNGSEGRQGL